MSTRACPRCGSELTPEGGCPRCLLELGLEAADSAGRALSEDEDEAPTLSEADAAAELQEADC